MNLVDILAEELPEWPEWCTDVTQNGSGGLSYTICLRSGGSINDYIYHYNTTLLKKATVAKDWDSAVVREVDWLKAVEGNKKAKESTIPPSNQVGYIAIVYSRDGARTDGNIYNTYEQAKNSVKGNVIAIAEVQWEEKEDA